MGKYSTVFMIGPRGSGRTAAIAGACKKLGATMLCANHAHAAQVKDKHGIPAVSIHSHFEGLRGPFLADHFAMEDVCYRYERKIKSLQQENAKLQAVVDLAKRMYECRADDDNYFDCYDEFGAALAALEGEGE